MRSAPKFSGDILLAAGWRISRVRKSLRTADKAGLIEFIRQRHRERFFEPIEKLRDAPGNVQGYGFAIVLVMASCIVGASAGLGAVLVMLFGVALGVAASVARLMDS